MTLNDEFHKKKIQLKTVKKLLKFFFDVKKTVFLRNE